MHSGAVVMSPDSEGIGAAVEAGMDSNLTLPSGISHFSGVLATVMILSLKSLLKFV